MNSSRASLLSDMYILTIGHTATNLVLSLPTNGYVVWLISTGSRGTLAAEFFALNLAVFEILFCLLSVGSFYKLISPSLKILSTLSFSFLRSGRPILQCCICVEQFLAVVHPVLFLRYKPLRYKMAFIGVAWAVIIGLSVFYTLIGTPIKGHVFVSECMILISVMLFCYFSVLVALKRPRPGKGKKERDNIMKRRAFRTIFAIIVSFVGTYVLWCVAILSNLRSWFTTERRIFTKTCTFITYASGFVQPLIYLQKSGKCSCSRAV